jgi:hypothetical protein
LNQDSFLILILKNFRPFALKFRLSGMMQRSWTCLQQRQRLPVVSILHSTLNEATNEGKAAKERPGQTGAGLVGHQRVEGTLWRYLQGCY